MEEQMTTGGTERLPQEVVEVYRPRDSREVVEVYTRPLPGRRARPAPKPAKRRKTGLWIFLACLIAVTALALAAWLLRECGGRVPGSL